MSEKLVLPTENEIERLNAQVQRSNTLLDLFTGSDGKNHLSANAREAWIRAVKDHTAALQNDIVRIVALTAAAKQRTRERVIVDIAAAQTELRSIYDKTALAIRRLNDLFLAPT